MLRKEYSPDMPMARSCRCKAADPMIPTMGKLIIMEQEGKSRTWYRAELDTFPSRGAVLSAQAYVDLRRPCLLQTRSLRYVNEVYVRVCHFLRLVVSEWG